MTHSQAVADRIFAYCCEHASELVTGSVSEDDVELTDAALASVAQACGVSLRDASTTYYDDVLEGLDQGVTNAALFGRD